MAKLLLTLADNQYFFNGIDSNYVFGNFVNFKLP
jgi:hypothetical protein